MYETFSDLNSVNHAELGVEILKRNSYIKKYGFNSDYEDIIFKAIFEHNRYKISEGLDSNEEMVYKKHCCFAMFFAIIITFSSQ